MIHFAILAISLVLLSLLLCSTTIIQSSFAVIKPLIADPNLKLEKVYVGNSTPELNELTSFTQFVFLENNDILVLNKNDGKVLRITNHTLMPEPVLDLNVTNQWESGLLGIAALNKDDRTYVFLYYTESNAGDVSNSTTSNPSYNKLYRYELINDKLLNPQLIFTSRTPNRYSHIGGALQIGPDNNVYLTVGDMHGDQNASTRTMAQNYNNGIKPDGRAGILRFTINGDPVGDGLLGPEYPLNLYYAYGIRNSFGLDFDPVSGKLWETEDGPSSGDEINLVEPGFNGGWNKMLGMRPYQNLTNSTESKGLVDFGGKGKYSAPEFVWKSRVAPTALKFMDSKQLGDKYLNDLFVASYNLGDIYDFDLNKNRTSLMSSNTSNVTSANKIDIDNIRLAQNLGRITDIDVGPDGNLYVLSNYHSKPTIFRISSKYESK
ncbi:MAG TPA: PQQ-dependent sugar dehydrogenase [Nitrososphaeraceae archaeon]